MRCGRCDHELTADELKAAAKEMARQHGLKGLQKRYGKKDFPQKRAPRADLPKRPHNIQVMRDVLVQAGLLEKENG